MSIVVHTFEIFTSYVMGNERRGQQTERCSNTCSTPSGRYFKETHFLRYFLQKPESKGLPRGPVYLNWKGAKLIVLLLCSRTHYSALHRAWCLRKLVLIISQDGQD